MAQIIDVDSLSFSYQEKAILKSISLSIKTGEALVVLGASGTGKTTFLRLLAGLLQPSSGSIRFIKPTTGINTRLVFQQPRLFPWMSVRNNLYFALRSAKVPRDEWDQRIEGLIAEVGLTDAIDRSVTELSVGMAQRIALVRGLCCQPKVLLLDEPFSALDPKRRLQLQKDLLHLIRLTNTTVVMVTHDIDEALQLADHIVVLQDSPATISLSLQPTLESREQDRQRLLEELHR